MNRIRLKYLAAEPITNGLGLSGAFDNVDWPRYIRTTDIRDERTLRDDVFASQPPSVAAGATVKPRDLLMTAAGATIGKSYLHYDTAPACYAGYLARLRPKPGVDERYISYWMQSTDYWAQIDTGAVRSTIDNFSAGKYRQLLVPMLSLEDQRRIADFLDDQVVSIDEIIRLREEQLEAVQQRLDSAILQDVAGAGAGVETPSVPWVGLLHERAELRPLVRSLVLQRGVDLTADQRSEGGAVPVVTTGGVVGRHDQSIADGPGVVIGRYGTVGNVHWVESSYWPHNTTLYVKDFRGNNPRWVYWLLRAFPYEMQQARAAVPGVNRNEMHPVLMPWLPVELQQRSVELLDAAAAAADSCVFEMQCQIALLQERKRSLITAAVTGEFDVTAASGRGVA